MGINEEIAKAFGAHGAWKTRIAQAIDSGHSEHKPEDVAVDHRCAFGKWLHDPSLPASIRSSEEYRTVVDLHADFHKAAGSTLAKALAGDTHGAHAELQGGMFARAADALSAAMIRWQRNAATECSGYRSGSWRAVCFFWKGKVSLRIWSAVAVPALAALGVMAVFDAQLARTATGTARMERMASVLTEVAATVQEMQKERGLSVAAAKGDPKLMAERQAQAAAVDARRRAMEAAASEMLPDMPPDLRDRWQAADSGFQTIENLRARIAGGGADPDKIVEGFSAEIDKLLGFEESSATLAVRPDVVRAMTTLIRVSRAKEAAGLERAIGAAAIAAGTVSPENREQLLALETDQAVRFRAYQWAATSEQRQALDRALSDPALAEFERYRAALVSGVVAGLDAGKWFAAATARIDRLHGVEDRILDDIRDCAREGNATARRGMMLFTAVVGLVLLGGGVLVWFLTRGITRPVQRLTGAMRHLATGQNRIDIPAIERPDEIGEMGRAVLVFQQQALDVERMTAEVEQQHRSAEEARRRSLVAMAEAIEARTGEVVARVAEESRRVNDTAGRMAKSAILVEENAQRVAAAAEQSLANAQAVAGASEQLSASIREIAAQVERSKEMVGEAVRAAGDASGTVASLAQAMSAIDDVVQVIAMIASQTNLLALNATIEAARAGDAGKGFAVVAHEVKNLANQTAKQTEDITARITTLKEMAGRVTAAIGDVVQHIHGVEEVAGSVAAAVEEQDAATGEISRNVQQSAQAAGEVTERIGAVAGEAATTGKQAEMVETLLEAMAEQVEELGHVLTKVVRTATPDVDRRANPRFAVQARVKLILPQGERDGDLIDISANGAHVGGLSGVPAGQRCTLAVDEVRVPAIVVESEKGVCRLKMEGKPDDALARWIARKGGGAIAA